MNSSTPTAAFRTAPVASLLLCAAVASTVLFSGIPRGNQVNLAITALFTGVAVMTALSRNRPFKIPPEVIIFGAWLLYCLIPSLAAFDIERSMGRSVLMIQIGTFVLFEFNVMRWNSRPDLFAAVYVVAAVLSYSASLVGFGFGIIDPEVLMERNAADRATGTLSNANLFGRTMVSGQLAVLLATLGARRIQYKLGLGIAFVLLGIAVVNSGSRTALVGSLFLCALLPWVYKLWKVERLQRVLGVLALLLTLLFVLFAGLKDTEIVSSRIESFMQNDRLISRYQNLFGLAATGGDLSAIDTNVETSITGRFYLAREAINTAVEHPLGIGLNNLEATIGTYAHSNYMELLATTGFVGLLLFYAIYGSMAFRSWQSLRSRPPDDTPFRVVFVVVLTQMVMDVGNVGYFSKSYWFLMVIAIATLDVSLRYRQEGEEGVQSGAGSQPFATARIGS